MKRFLTLVLISTLLFNSQALAATKKPTVKPLKLITSVSNVDEYAGLVTSGTTIVVYGNKGDKSFAKGVDITGKELWNLALDSASPSVATAATVDSAGTIWIAGSTSLQRATPTPSPIATPLNPDNITAIPDIFTTDLDAFTLWSLNPTTQALTQYSLQLTSPILINAISASKSGLTAVGSSGAVINSDLSGKISKPVFVGSGATNLEAVVKASDGSMTVVGSSSETLSGKKLAGKVDGVIIKLSKIGKVISVVRSSAPKALRNWNSASTSLLLGGEVITSNKIESAVTKFSNSYMPTWTYRFLSTGKTFTSGSTYAFLQSKGALTQLANWSPKSPTPLLLTFDAKGAITGGYSAPVEQKEVLGLYFSKDLGILCISASADTVSIFTLN
ncbi:MAG: hypothetical protein F2690_03095 [Actinobacteria bacterium]|uniref:Unannotated protein n=1 Tax=freshwater metagenome TaxID=449393 RepID=A0A6J6ZBN8_9ZZZZ|nr:hypothetical protein [Actinomycetota bacterium]MSX71365.1 hypothetical protein [Actinomycetota bacterium]MSY69537.1 hypothetical protein [Actinomycetota bacterium]MTA75386.1 hypothetical protein [Actinomycetota bacterium]